MKNGSEYKLIINISSLHLGGHSTSQSLKKLNYCGKKNEELMAKNENIMAKRWFKA